MNEIDTWMSREALRAIWARQLGRDVVDEHDNFFELGGQSLTAVLILAEWHAASGRQLQPSVLFTYPVFADFFKQAEHLAATIPVATSIPITAPFATTGADVPDNTAENIAPLSFQQTQLWAVTQLAASSAKYNIPLAYRLEGDIDADALLNALRLVAQRHDVLRTTYSQENHEPVQRVHPELPFVFHETVIQETMAGYLEQAIDTFVATELDLEHGAPFAVHLLRTTPTHSILLLCLHHIAFDGFSMRPFFAELVANYQLALAQSGRGINRLQNMLVADRRPSLPSYRTFARQSRAYAAQGGYDEGVAYFKQYLAELEPLNSLPTDMARHAVSGAGTALTLSSSIDADALQSLQALARRYSTTPFIVFYAALCIIIARHTYRDDVVIGVPTANRLEPGWFDAIGFFANNIVLRNHVDFLQSFEAYLHTSTLNVQHTFAHHQTPFPLVVDALAPIRSSAYNPLFQIAFAFQNTPEPGEILPGIKANPMPLANPRAKFDLTINVVFSAKTARVEWEFDQRLFQSANIASLMQHYHVLLRAIVSRPKAALCDLVPVEAESAEEAMLAHVSAHSAEAGAGDLISLFDEVVHRFPAKTAIIHPQGRMDYRQLARASEHLARRIRAQLELFSGRIAGEPIVFVAARNLASMMTQLAILKAGAAYVPLDLSYPAAHITYLLNNSGARLFIDTGSGVPAGLPPGMAVLRIDGQALENPSDTPLPRSSKPDDHAYLMYTSGSTGEPKGVWISHRGIVRLVSPRTGIPVVPLGPSTVMLHASSPSFDAATFEIWGALLHGGTLVCYDVAHVDILEIAKIINAQQVNTMWLTAGLLEDFAALDQRMPSLRWLLTGGDIVPPTAVAQLQHHEPQLTLVNGYGPTENTTFTCCHHIERPVDISRPLPIGRPIAGTGVQVIGLGGTRCGINEPGELWICGEGLAQGYHNVPETQAAKFVSRNGRTWYRTGDSVCLRASGVFDYLRRADTQIKIRSYRIETDEIVLRLKEHPAIHAACILPLGTSAATKTLAAFVSLRESSNSNIGALRHWLAQKLPAYSIPNRWFVVDDMPVTPNGKIDRHALIALTQQDSPPQDDIPVFLAPASSEAKRIMQAWLALLGMEATALQSDTNLFEHGGNSLTAIRLAARLSKELGFSVPVATIYDNPTFGAFIEWVGATQAVTDEVLSVPKETRPVVFAIPGVGGLAASFAPLHAELKRRHVDLVTFDAPGLNDSVTLTLEHHVLAVVEAIEAHVPQGDITLVGHSFGARIAFDVAHTLEQSNRRITLILLDALPGNDLVNMQIYSIGETPHEVALWLLTTLPSTVPHQHHQDDPIAQLETLQIYGDLPITQTLTTIAQQATFNRRYHPRGALATSSVRLIYAKHGLIGVHPMLKILASLRVWVHHAEVYEVDANHFSMLGCVTEIADVILANNPDF